ncbi:DUF5365 family protein [Niallia taxi]|uniref:Uncharacterized protein n=1 Tax=Niallia taxi TaxID=2499688 RepID=A0A437KHM2_9BACI|nr:DUF5365 family protein [Niallia taxi]MCM3216200.1 YhcU family protein [Niallia taxi]MCT2342543.1 YhcU family protein [Niallia taxi]MDE5050857.1 DUF5365 family protein [Niallia taxi]MDK8643038.1 DUF5365 family protein [Niallia taxi]MED3965582.1 DUF5365 family protein [Niallia taxi]
MKVAYASTPAQEEQINELIQTFYTSIFPDFFSDDEINKFSNLNVLRLTQEQSYMLSTLKNSYQVIAALQTIISIVENSDESDEYDHLFERNVEILDEFELFFPFRLDNFSKKDKSLSIYSEAANEYLL